MGSGRSPGRNKEDLLRFELGQKNASPPDKNVKIYFDPLQHIVALNWNKFGTGFVIRENSASRMTSYFSGETLKILDCPEKSGTDGHVLTSIDKKTNVNNRPEKQEHI